MFLPKQYDFVTQDQRYYQMWVSQGFFASKPNPKKEPYTVVMPPPNITGVLHMGHVLNNTIQDIMVRRARMQGKEACWVPGIDHASIATEARVVAALHMKGIDKRTLTREAFLKHAWEWKTQYGGIILEQLRALGASCDWERTRFTMDPRMSEAVLDAFVKLYEEGYLYRGKRMINWDPRGGTALADDEVVHKEVQGKLYHIAYRIADSDERVVVATTRPETLLGDTALCVHPEDERYLHLHGKEAWVPLVGRKVPIITDAYVSQAFGTGCLKVTPAHDPNDYALAQKHHLPILEIMTPEARISKAAGHYVGEDRFVARQHIIVDLKERGQMIKITNHTHQIGFSERTDAVIEPQLSTQWFVKMKALAKPALEAVEAGCVTFYPAKFQNMYRAWLTQVRDWCISRQLWWGHRIPAYHLPDGSLVVARTPEEALQEARRKLQDPSLPATALSQDPDVLDTWFSSWLWPMSVFEGTLDPANADFAYYYPTADLVTAPEIIFFWVARMVMAGKGFTGKAPFKRVYFTGLVRDKQGKKMSKSLGNAPDTNMLITKYGADGVRAGILFAAPAGQDVSFDEHLCLQGRNFVHKLWQALRLVKGWEVGTREVTAMEEQAITWMEIRLDVVLEQLEAHFAQFRLSEALILLYKFSWEEFCAHYLEMIKPTQGEQVSQVAHEATVVFFEKLVKVLHPFIPFVTEAIWQALRPRQAKEALVVAPWPTYHKRDQALLKEAQHAFTLISQLRQLRTEHHLPGDTKVTLCLRGQAPTWLTAFAPYIMRRAGVGNLLAEQATPAGATFVLGGWEFWLPKVVTTRKQEDLAAMQKELHYMQGFLDKVHQKLANRHFMAHAPAAVVAREKQKQEDSLAKVQALQQLIAEAEGNA